jgi:chain length determinant protein tyrosine kinase EpsG
MDTPMSDPDRNGPITQINPEREFVEVRSIDAAEQLLGSLLIDAGTLSKKDVERIVGEQNRTGRRFGEVAQRLGLVKRDDLEAALYRQFDFPYVAKGDRSVSSKVSMAFHPGGPLARAIRTLRSQLMTSWFDGRPERNVLAIAGVGRGEGRSFIAANLAVAFAQLGERTLLIDADLRRPAQHVFFKLHGRLGLSGLLAGRGGLSEITRVQAIPHLSVLPAGAIPPNPQELLARRRFTELMDDLAQNFDVILVDTAAAESESDALVVARRTRGAMLVARRDQTSLQRLGLFRARLDKAGVESVGVIFNDH